MGLRARRDRGGAVNVVSTYGKGALTQLRVIHAVALRETRTRFGTHQLGYLWALLEPLFWILTFWSLFTVVGRDAPSGMEVVPFLATGVIPYDLVMKTSDRASASIDANKALLFYPQVQPLDLILARGGLEIATLIAVFFAIVGGYALIVQRFALEDILTTMFGMTLAGMLGMAFGSVLCALGVLSKTVERIKGPLLRPLFWVSGLFFTADHLPTAFREVALYNPILHCVEIVRDGWFAEYHGHHASPGYVLGWIVVLAFIGLTLERAVRQKIELS
jgi:capsular polysaccharide transport system permease protein